MSERNKVIVSIHGSRSPGILAPDMILCTVCWEHIFYIRSDGQHICPKCAGMEYFKVKDSLEFARYGGEEVDSRKQTAPKGKRSKKPPFEDIEAAIIAHKGVMIEAARFLGFPYPTVYKWIKDFHPQLMVLSARLRKENGLERGHYSRGTGKRQQEKSSAEEWGHLHAEKCVSEMTDQELRASIYDIDFKTSAMTLMIPKEVQKRMYETKQSLLKEQKERKSNAE